MDWDLCVICGNGGDLKCPADSHQKNGLEVYSKFLDAVKEFEELQSLPVNVDFKGEDKADLFMANQAKWHKSCHLKFASSKLLRVKGKKRKLEVPSSPEKRCKRQSTATTSERGCIFCLEVGGKLHSCSTMQLDHNLKKMATELQDSVLLARISGGDLIAIEAKYHYNCLSSYKNRYRSVQRANSNTGISKEEKVIRAQAFVELVCHIESVVENGTFIFKLSELHSIYEGYLHDLGVDKTINRTRLKVQLLDYFFGDCQEQCDGKNVMLVFNEGLKKLLKESMDAQDYESQMLVMAKVVKFLRREILSSKSSPYTGSFLPECQSQSVPAALKLFVSMLLKGYQKKEQCYMSQASLTISQLIHFNVRGTSSTAINAYHSKEREPPLPLYLGLNIHTQTRSKKLVNKLNKLGLCISYDRVIELENSLATAVCKCYEEEQLVCPANLRKRLFTVGAFDNLDYNPSSTTSKGSFHGGGISIFQFPSTSNSGIARNPVSIDPSQPCKHALPDNYTTIPAVACDTSKLRVPEYTVPHEVHNVLEVEKAAEARWIQHGIALIHKNMLGKDEYISWGAFHASLTVNPTNPPSLNALLPLFYEKAATVAMVKHAMSILQQVTDRLNPGQIPAMAFDQPLYTLAKSVQWLWPDIFGEKRFVAMFGGLHIEMALWTTLGNYLDGSGWTTAISEAEIASTGVADSFLKASHLTKTRHCHQVTLLALSKLQYEAWEHASQDGVSFEVWRGDMIGRSPTFQYWDTVMRFEILVLVFIRAHRTKNFNLYVESLEALVPWFFALDHINYARWIPIHIRDMKSLPLSFKEQFENCWVVQKTKNRFSCMPIDQAHEQNNKLVKGSGGAVGLTENPSAFRRWMVAGPEQARLLVEFESQFMDTADQNCLQHEQSCSIQATFKRQVNSLCEVVSNMGNPFLDDCPELLVLDSRNCCNEDVAATIRSIEELGKTQYHRYYVDVIKDRSVPIQQSIKKNFLPLFKQPLSRNFTKKKQQIAGLKSDCNLFSQLYIASQFRDGDLQDFFTHENQPWPPSLSEHGKLRLPTKKSDLLKCIGMETTTEPTPSFDVMVFDGSAIVHALSTKLVKTFDEYFHSVFMPWTESMLRNSDRIDIIWDIYRAESLKECTRERRGKGIRRKVSGQANLPSNFQDFLCDSKNKQELFDFLTDKVSSYNHYPLDKEIYITAGSSVAHNGPCSPLELCDHEEADTRMCVHIKDALEKGCRKVYVRTVDTDVIVIIAGIFFELLADYPGLDLWVGFGMGKYFQQIHVNNLYQKLGELKCKGLPFFHSFTGCDTTSQFHGKGKKSAWEAWKSYPSVTEAFEFAVAHPFQHLDDSSSVFQLLERFTCVLYDKTTSICKVNELRQDLFSKKARAMENIPPTKAALLQHANRAIYQASIWTMCLQAQQNPPTPELFGWSKEKGGWKPVWTHLPEVAKACQELLKCGCKALLLCSRKCKCKEAGLSCTGLCHCKGQCDS